MVAEVPLGRAHDLESIIGPRVDVGDHRVGGKEPRARQPAYELDLAVGAHRADKGPAGITLRHGWKPEVVDRVTTAQGDVASSDLLRAPAVGGRIHNRQQG